MTSPAGEGRFATGDRRQETEAGGQRTEEKGTGADECAKVSSAS